MNPGANQHRDLDPTALSAGAARVRAIALWLGHLVRFRDAARAGGPHGPTAIRLRAELQAGLPGMIATAAPLALQFSAQEIACGPEPLILEQAAKEALLRLAHVGGVRSLRFAPGLPAAEFDAFLLSLLRAGDDLSPGPRWGALLRERALPHIEAEFSRAEAPMEPATAPAVAPTVRAAASSAPPTAEPEGIRADDWTGGGVSVLSERPTLFPAEPPPAVADLRAVYVAERGRSLVRAALDAVRPCFALSESADERSDFRQFLTRALRFAFVSHAWEDGSEVVDLLLEDPAAAPEVHAIAQEVLGDSSSEDLWNALDAMPQERVRAYVDLVRRFDALAPECLLRAMAESNERRNRRLFAQALSEICRENPARLEPGLDDLRWFVVRNVVFVLGLIGGDAIVPHLRRVIRHPERRVRRQCLVALGTVSPAAARPLLFGFLVSSDPELSRGALEMLAARRDAPAAGKLLDLLQDPSGDTRSAEDRLALCRAVAATADETILVRLEEILVVGKASPRTSAQEFLVLARTAAAVGGEMGRELLTRGQQSRHGLIRSACATALGGMSADG